jgi:hypothetical protein
MKYVGTVVRVGWGEEEGRGGRVRVVGRLSSEGAHGLLEGGGGRGGGGEGELQSCTRSQGAPGAV